MHAHGGERRRCRGRDWSLPVSAAWISGGRRGRSTLEPSAAVRAMHSTAFRDLDGSLCSSAGNVVLLVEMPHHLGSSGSTLQWSLEPSSASPEIIGFLSAGEGLPYARFWNPDGTPERICGNALRSIPFSGLSAGAARRIATDHCVAGLRRVGGQSGFSFPISRAVVRRLGPGEYLVDVGTPHRVEIVEALRDRRVVEEGWDRSRGPGAVNATFVAPRARLSRRPHVRAWRGRDEVLRHRGARRLPRGERSRRSYSGARAACSISQRRDPDRLHAPGRRSHLGQRRVSTRGPPVVRSPVWPRSPPSVGESAVTIWPAPAGGEPRHARRPGAGPRPRRGGPVSDPSGRSPPSDGS